MKKFLIVAPRFHTNLYFSAKSLVDAGHTVKVFVMYKGKSEFYEHIDLEQLKHSLFTILLKKVYSIFKKKYLKSKIAFSIQSPGNNLKAKIKSYKPNVIILKEFKNLLAIKTLFAAKKAGLPVLILIQTGKTQIKGSRLLFGISSKIFARLGVLAYVTPIKTTYNAFINFGIKNIFYVPFVFPSKSNIRKSEISETVNFLSIGKFVKRKDHILLIKAVETLLNRNYLIKLNIYGEIADKKYFNFIKNYIQENNLTKNIMVHSNISYTEIVNKYPKNDVFILPSYSEPAAYTPVEAMAYGLPVICSSECGTKCYIKNDVNGYIFKSKDLEDLILNIENLISDRQKLKQMSTKTMNLFKQNHEPVLFLEKIMAILDNRDND